MSDLFSMDCHFDSIALSMRDRKDLLAAFVNRKGGSVAAVIEELLSTGGEAALILGGSVLEGVANTTSDLDAFVLVDDEAKSGVRTGVISDIRIDYESWAKAQLTACASDVFKSLDLTKRLPTLDRNTVRALGRIISGIPFPDEADVAFFFDDGLQTALSIYLTRNALYHAENCLQDTLGALSDGQYDYGISRSRQALEYAIDAYLARRMYLELIPKYRIMILRNRVTEDQGILQTYLDAMREWPFDDTDKARVIERNATSTKKLLLQISKHVDAHPSTYYS